MSIHYKKMPGPNQHWLKGNFGEVDRTKIHRYFYQVARDFGGTARIRFFSREFIIFQQADTVQFLLKNRPERFRRVKAMERIFKEMSTHGVFSAESADWKKQRRFINPAFTPSQIKGFYPQLVGITHRLLKAIERMPKAVDVQSLLMSYTVDITSTLAFGSDVNTLENSDSNLQDSINQIFPMISYRLRAPFPYWRWFKLERDRKLDGTLKVVMVHIESFIASAREKIQARNALSVDEAQNVLETMLLVRDEQGNGFSDKEIFGNVLTLLLGGEDTTANTLAWAIDFLADRPDLQTALHKEILEKNEIGKDVGYEELTDYPLVSSVIHETMRLKPVAPHLYLEPIHDEVIEGYHVPAGTNLIALLNGDGFDESLFPHCQLFDPYRWITMPDETKRQFANRLMPFGYGPRLCPGRQLSLVEMRLCLISLIKQFQFVRTTGTTPAEEVIKFSLQPEGLRVDFTAR